MNQVSTSAATRPLDRIVAAVLTLEGGGFEVYRPFPTATLDLVDPFLLLDELGRVYHPPGQAVGAPDHPHRGFETVSYTLEGEVAHRDSAGNHGLIRPGEVQWMTAGDGIVHSEMPSERLQTEGGWVHGLQVWVNLPRALKRTPPKYQPIGRDQIATVAGDGWEAEVVAGTILGAVGPAETNSPIGYARVTIDPGAQLRIPVATGHTALVYAFAGSGTVAGTGQPLEAHHLAVFERSGGDVLLEVADGASSPLDTIVLTGEPLNEPVARHGPFVMNSRAELVEAVDDFRAGRMGSIPAAV
ncbi:pirin family protein [Acidimicrobiaceae bacterium AH-315-P05]|nr:pirin family protein [Acidimicrobiaceae bacterium AH-315-P05]